MHTVIKIFGLKILYIILFSVFLLSPFFELKLFCILCLTWLFLKGNQNISKVQIFLFLFLIYSFSFIFSPYWHVFHIRPHLKYVLLGCLFLGGVLWVNVVTQKLKLPKMNLSLTSLFALAGSLYILVYKALGSDIAWRGDEDFHIRLILNLISYLEFWWEKRTIYLFNNPLFWLLMLVLVCVVLFRIRQCKPIWHSLKLILIPLSGVLLYPMYVFKDVGNSFILSDALRYPFFQKWLQLLFIFPNTYGDVKLYRALPFMSLVFISWYLYFQLQKKLNSKLVSFWAALVLATIPLLLFYSTLVYLELPLVLVMLVVVFNVKPLVQANFRQLKTYPAWYALLLIGFLKETGLIVSVLLILLRIFYRLQKSVMQKEIRLSLFSELKLSLFITFPGLLYLGFRYIFGYYHPYEFRFAHLLNFNNFIVTAQALFIQTGAFCIIAFLGLVWLFKRRDKFTAVAITTLLVGTLVFFLSYVYLDFTSTAAGIVYVGYSRWLLYLLPPLEFAAIYFLTRLKQALLLVMLSILFLFNLRFLPFAPDGTRFPNWGAGGIDVGEYTYPYAQAIRFLAQNHLNKILYTGHYSPYSGLRFYFSKYNYSPQIWEYPFANIRFDEQTERAYITTFFDKLANGQLEARFIDAKTILYHSVNNLDLDTDAVYTGTYRVESRFRNAYHSLYVFKKIN